MDRHQLLDCHCRRSRSLSGFDIGGTTGNTPKSCADTELDAFVGKDVLGAGVGPQPHRLRRDLLPDHVRPVAA